jgi:hypothetical protein
MGKPVEMVVEINDRERYRKVKAIVDKTNKERPKAEDVAELRRMLQEDSNLWRVAGDFSAHALHKITSDIEATPFVVESVRAGVDKLKEELGYEFSPSLEKMLINQITLCWLRLNMLEHTHWVKTWESHSTETGLYWDRRLLTAQRRFTRACETLARVRKLSRNIPALQVNIATKGGQQMNITKQG